MDKAEYRKAKAIMLHESRIYIGKTGDSGNIMDPALGLADLSSPDGVPHGFRISRQDMVSLFGMIDGPAPQTVFNAFPYGLELGGSFQIQPEGFVIVELLVSIPCAGMVNIRTVNKCFEDGPDVEPYIEESTHCGSFTVAWE